MLDLLVYLFVFGACSALLLMVLGYKYRDIGDTMLYHPDSPPGSTRRCDSPATFGIATFEKVAITTKDGVTLRGFWMHPSSSSATAGRWTLVYFHGNAGNVGHRLPIARMFLHALHCSVLMVDYRTYGMSDKAPPTEDGLEADGDAVLDYVANTQGIDRSRVLLMGTSLGGAVVTYLATRPRHKGKFGAIILENTFTSISDMVDVLFTPLVVHAFPRGQRVLVPFLKHCIKPLLLFIGWNSIDRIHSVDVPILFLSGAQDEIVPSGHMHALHDAATGSTLKVFVSFPSGTHNDLPGLEGYVGALRGFIAQLAAGGGHHLGGHSSAATVPV